MRVIGVKGIMNRFFRLALAPLILALALGISSSAFAGEAQTYMQGKQTELTTVLKLPKSDSTRAAKLATLLDGMFDYDKLAADSIGSNADTASAEQMTEFRSLLKKLVRNAYQKNIEKTLNYEVTWVSDTGGTDDAVVATEAKPKQGDTVSIKYKLHKSDGKWSVNDVITEDASLVNGYRNQFNKSLKNGGWDNLLKKLRARAARGQ
jgi:phospholipid transport system substrate-binding protein